MKGLMSVHFFYIKRPHKVECHMYKVTKYFSEIRLVEKVEEAENENRNKDLMCLPDAANIQHLILLLLSF